MTIRIDIVSDIMCPWCYIGKRKLEEALQELDDIDFSVHWRPYQLDPTLPQEGRDRKEYLENKFGGPERAQEIYSNIENAGRAEGLDFAFSKIAVSPNTLDAHRLIRWAANESEAVQNHVVERLFELFFVEGANIGRHDVLIGVAKEAGMNASVVEGLLSTPKDRDAVEEEIAVARQMGVTGVPCFIIEEKYALMGAQPAEQIKATILQAKAEGAS